MFGEEVPVFQKPSFWIGIGLAVFGLLLWVYPELLSVLVGALFVGLGGVLIVRAVFQKRRFDIW